MPNDQLDVRRLAQLAHFNLTEEEISTFQPQLETIMQHIESLTRIELPDDLEPEAPAQLGILRDDSPQDSLLPEQVLQNAPDQAQSMIRVPKVVADA